MKKTKAKIALLINSLSIAGGAQRVAAMLASCLSDYYDVIIINVYANGSSAYEVDDRVKVLSLYPQAPSKLRYIYLGGARRLRSVLKAEQVEVLMAIDSGTTFIPFLCRLVSQVKLIYCEHGTYNRYTMQHLSWLQKLKKLLFWSAIFHIPDYVVALTAKEKGLYTDCKVPLTHIYNPLDDRLLAPPPPYSSAAKKIITCGRIDIPKGYEQLIAVAERVLRAHPDWQWHIYGGGDDSYRACLEADAARRGLSKQLHFMGNHKNIYDIYPQYSFYVMTSRWEGFGLVLLEAKANGLPVVSFDIYSGPSDIVRDGVDGYLVPPFDIDSMAERINYLIENPVVREKFAANARGNLDKFSKEKIIARWRGLIDGLLR